jgi:ParB/RepB/Spo0J family partition protein
MQTKLEHVKLSQIIESVTNKIFRDPEELTAEALSELVGSVKQRGVIQPVLLRPHPIKKDHYELICGERRFKASGYAKLDSIPAYIKDLNDDDAFECQMEENINREDPNPMKQANAYKHLMDKDPKRYTIDELAVKFGKTPHYIMTRLKLIDLVPEIRKDFMADKLSLASALVIARLEPKDQLEVKKHCQDSWNEKKYRDVKRIEDYIENSIMCNLSSAPFKKDDATLNSSMGPCTTCQFRTGANQLFADIKNKDRCMNRGCFAIKQEVHLFRVIKDTIENKPDILILQDYRPATGPIQKLLKDLNAKILKSGTDFNTWGNGKGTKGLWISGSDAGKIEAVHVAVSKKGKAVATGGKATVQDDINRIEEKMTRDKGNAAKKVYERMWKELMVSDSVNKIPSSDTVTQAEDALLTYFLVERIAYDLDDDSDDVASKEYKKLKLQDPDELDYMDNEKEIEKYYKKVGSLSRAQKMFILRRFLLKECNDKYAQPESPKAYFIRKFAEAMGIPVADFDKEQAELLAIQEEKAKARIKELKDGAKKKKPVAAAKEQAKRGLAALLKKDEVEEQVNGKKKTPASGVTNVPKFIADQKKKLKEAGVEV